jgi:Carbonic anhydrase
MQSRLSWKSFSVVLLFGIAAIPTIITSQDAHSHHWAYEGKEGPAEWGKIDTTFAACSMGTQSPIDIKGAVASDLPTLKFDYKAVPLNIIDNGHTIQINYPAGSKLTVGDKTYALQQIHFHHPSEERINGHPSDMVAHFVHSDSDGHLAVVAVLLKQGAENSSSQQCGRTFHQRRKKPFRSRSPGKRHESSSRRPWLLYFRGFAHDSTLLGRRDLVRPETANFDFRERNCRFHEALSKKCPSDSATE